MFCNNCGNQIPDNSGRCPYCGNIMGYNQGMRVRKKAKIDNIFSALIHEKTPGAILEFSFWCGICLMALLSFIACVLVESETEGYGVALRILWVFMMIFQLGLGVMLAFRIKPIMLLVSSAVFYVLMPIWFFVVTAGGGGAAVGTVVMFIFMLITGTGLTVVAAIHFFSKFNLKHPLVIIAIVAASILLILIVCTYAIEPGTGVYDDEWDREMKGAIRHVLITYGNNIGSYWLGSLSYWITGTVITLFYVFFFWGCIDSRKDKIYTVNAGGAGRVSANVNAPGIQCISGINAGQIYYLNGNELIIGSGQGVNIYINSPYVSKMHCSIRFNPASGMYEIRDTSMNGVFLQNGAVFEKGKYNQVGRGAVIYIGSREQQFRLL